VTAASPPSSSTAEIPAPRPLVRRPRDAAATKRALLGAAQSLFGQHGFEGATVRDIGERAGVDAALIARYFGSKADLYIAAVVAEGQGDQPPREFEGLSDMAEAMVSRTDLHGLGPVTQALIRSDTPEEIRQAARAHLARRLVAPMVTEKTRRGVDRPQIRAEVVVAALLGINLGRALGWFADLQAVSKDELVELVTAVLDSGSGLDSESGLHQVSGADVQRIKPQR
jgi:AcrR family transcriptional regulator